MDLPVFGRSRYSRSLFVALNPNPAKLVNRENMAETNIKLFVVEFQLPMNWILWCFMQGKKAAQEDVSVIVGFQAFCKLFSFQ